MPFKQGVAKLQALCSELKENLATWKDILLASRQKFYYLTFVNSAQLLLLHYFLSGTLPQEELVHIHDAMTFINANYKPSMLAKKKKQELEEIPEPMVGDCVEEEFFIVDPVKSPPKLLDKKIERKDTSLPALVQEVGEFLDFVSMLPLFSNLL